MLQKVKINYFAKHFDDFGFTWIHTYSKGIIHLQVKVLDSVRYDIMQHGNFVFSCS